MPGRNSSSTATKPSPWQVSHRPPATLKENRPRRSRARGLGRREQLAHGVEQPGVGGEVRARRTADRPLVDAHQPVERLQPGRAAHVRPRASAVVRSLAAPGPRWRADELGQHLRDQRRLARARDAGHRGEHAERNVDDDVAQVVPGDAAQLQPAVGVAGLVRRAASRGEQVGAGGRPSTSASPATGPLYRTPAALAGARARRRRASRRGARRPCRAPPRTASCPRPSAARAPRAAARRRRDAGRPTARRARRPRRTGPSAAGWRSAAAAARPATASGAAAEAEVAQPQLDQHLDPRDQVGATDGDLGRLAGVRESAARPAAGDGELAPAAGALSSAMRAPANVTASASGRSPLRRRPGTARSRRTAAPARASARSWSRRACASRARARSRTGRCSRGRCGRARARPAPTGCSR